MKKQIVYPLLIPRIFSTTIDLFILTVISMIPMNLLASYVFMWSYKPYFVANNITTLNNYEIPDLMNNSSEFIPYLTVTAFLTNIAIMLTLYLLVFGCYFIGFWHYKSATPGKMIMRMKIVDAETFGPPSLAQLIKRFFGYLLFAIGLWSIVFSKKRQALHDKIASTVVIKS